MKRTVVACFLCLLLLAFALPASASSVNLVFTDANNTIIAANTYAFKGNIVTTFQPDELLYRFEVRQKGTNTLINSCELTSSVAKEQWKLKNRIYTGEFEFTAQFGTYTGEMTVFLEAWHNNTRVAHQSLDIQVLPLQVKINQANNMVVSDNEYEFTGNITSQTNTLTLSYLVTDTSGNVIDRSTASSPVVVTATNALAQGYNIAVKFNADFGNYTGTAKVTLQATDGTRTATNHITVVVQRTVDPPASRITQFKNRGQLVRYVVKRLKAHGYGTSSHKNLGQALKYALRHSNFSTLTTEVQVDQFIQTYIVNAPTTTAKKGRKIIN